MRQNTRFKFNAFMSRLAELNNVETGDMNKKFTVEPAVTQTLMNRVQESSDFLTRINIVPVSEMKGEKVGIGVSGSIASTTDTAGGDERETADFSALDSTGYECVQVNYDFHIRYNTLDLWARYEDFQARLRDAIIKRQSLDRIMIGFNGVERAKTSNRAKNPMLQDVAVGWLQKYRNDAPKRVMNKTTAEDGTVTLRRWILRCFYPMWNIRLKGVKAKSEEIKIRTNLNLQYSPYKCRIAKIAASPNVSEGQH